MMSSSYPSLMRRVSSSSILFIAIILSISSFSPILDVIAQNGDCTLIVPLLPLTAIGLSTPFMLTATNAALGPCNQANTGQSAFVQGTILDLSSGEIFVYNPLVIDVGTKPAILPVVPVLPQSFIVVLHFGSNGMILRLKSGVANLTTTSTTGTDDALMQGNCVNGGGTGEYTPFGQVSYCNAPAFFTAARRAIQAGTLVVPPLLTTKQGLVCPSTRDFSIVDQDPSDNVITKYVLSTGGLLAQDTPANRAAVPGYTLLDNGSDNLLLAEFVGPAIGCVPWMARDLADRALSPSVAQSLPALALDEMQAAVYQPAPIAYVTARDPMILNSRGVGDINKLNAYRRGVAQFEVSSMTQVGSSAIFMCRQLYTSGAARISQERPLTVLGATLDPAVGSNLYAFLVARFLASVGPAAPGLNCPFVLNIVGFPFAATTNANGVVTDGTINAAVVAKAKAIVDTSTVDPPRQIDATINRLDLPS